MRVHVEGLEAFALKLELLKDRTRDLRPAFRIVARNLRRKVREQFTSRGAAGGTPWRGLSPATMRARARGRGYYRAGSSGARPLVATGKLMRSFTERSSGKHVEDIGRTDMEWGSKHPLAHLHAQGVGARGRAGPLPKREILAFRDDAEEDRLVREPVRLRILEGLDR